MKIRWLNVAIAAVLGFLLGYFNAKSFGILVGFHAASLVWGVVILLAFAITWLVVEAFTIRCSRVIALLLAVFAGTAAGFYGLLENTNPTRGALGFGIPALLIAAFLGALIGFAWDKIRKNEPDQEIPKDDDSYIAGGGLSLRS